MPKPDTGPLAHRPRVEPVVDEVLEVLAHANLPHELVLVAVHARELPDVAKGVLQAVGKLVRIDVAEPKLHVGVHDQLGQAKNLAAQVKRVAKATLFTLLGRERLDRLEVEVVVQVQVVQVLAVTDEKCDQQVDTLPRVDTLAAPARRLYLPHKRTGE